jgi:hypothetical protein
MNTMSNNISELLPEPGFPMLRHMVSSALFPDMTSGTCTWNIDEPHPLVPEMRVLRMFVVDGGVHVYSAPPKGACTRSFIPMGWVRLIEEVMPISVFVEELAATVVQPGSPMVTRMVSNPLSKKDEPVVWIVGQPHPHSLSGENLKVLRIHIQEDVAEIYSVAADNGSGTRHYIPIGQVRFSEEGLTPDQFVKEIEVAENVEDNEPDDDDEPETPTAAPVEVPNGQQTAPS